MPEVCPGLLTSTKCRGSSRKGDQGDEGWHLHKWTRGTRAKVYTVGTVYRYIKDTAPHHNQVWAAGGAVIRPDLEMQNHICKAAEAHPCSFITMSIPSYSPVH